METMGLEGERKKLILERNIMERVRMMRKGRLVAPVWW